MQYANGQRVQFIEKIEARAIDGLDLSNVVSMVNHKLTLGKRSKGTMDIDITPEAVNYSVRIPNTTIGNDAREDIKNGNLEGSSFQFSLAKGGDIWDKTKNPIERTITKFSSISEIGPVNYPAYPDTTAAMRSLEEVENEDKTKEEEANKEFEQRLARLTRKYNYSKLKTNK
jgi:HK97 family phage prohead protease